jgi:hypothetical protein
MTQETFDFMQETFDQLWEDSRQFTQRRGQNIEDWCHWRISYGLQDLEFEEYLHRMRFLRQNLSRAENREYGWQCSVNEWDCYLQGRDQQWRCALTGNELSFDRGGEEFNGQTANPKSCSIDRIDPNKGYVPGNIQLVTWEANLLKRNFDMQELKRLVRSMVDHLML